MGASGLTPFRSGAIFAAITACCSLALRLALARLVAASLLEALEWAKLAGFHFNEFPTAPAGRREARASWVAAGEELS
jgi:hypothetical protein